jgi:predicted metal-dependent hydrolase
MDEHQPSLTKRSKTLEYRIAARQFETAFEACERLPDNDKELLLREVAARLLKQLRIDTVKEEPTVKVVGIEIKQV